MDGSADLALMVLRESTTDMMVDRMLRGMLVIGYQAGADEEGRETIGPWLICLPD
jgi:hypothetical protein